mgnify:CR=1 FL=1
MLRSPSLIPLSHQHQHGLALCVLIDRGLRGDPSDATVKRLHRQLRSTLETELTHHFQVEERILFPAVRDIIASPNLVDDLVKQHRKVEKIAFLLTNAVGDKKITLLREFAELLSGHIRIEERCLSQEIQSKLSVNQLAEIGSKVDENLRRVCPASGGLPWEKSKVR